MVARFGYWVKVNIFNYFVVVEDGEQRGYPSLSYVKIFQLSNKKGLPLISTSFPIMMHLT